MRSRGSGFQGSTIFGVQTLGFRGLRFRVQGCKV